VFCAQRATTSFSLVAFCLQKQNSVGVSHSHVFALPITVSWASISRSRQCFKANYSPEENLGREGVWYGK
jgi:hypothetical protein